MRYRFVLTSTQKFFLGFFAVAILAIPAYASNILDDIGQTYYNASSAWEASLFTIAKHMFLKLALLEILWFGIWWTIEKDDPRQFFTSLLRKIMGLLFFWAILLNFDTWIPAIIDGFSQAGQTAGGTGALTPSTVLDRGMEVATKILSTSSAIGLVTGSSSLGKFLLAAIASLTILLAFVVIAGQMLVTLIESYLVVNAGVLFLGFAGSRWTTTFSEKFLSYAVSVGVKLFVTYLIIGAGQSISSGWAATITSDMVVSDYLSILGGAIVYMFLAWQIPALASSMLTGAVSMTLGSAMATAGTMTAATIGAAGAATALASGTANSVAGAVRAGDSAITQAKEKGASSMSEIAAGSAVALASGMGEAAKDGIKGLGENSAGGRLSERIDNKTAAIKEEKAAASVAAPSVPGGQPSAPNTGAEGGAAPNEGAGASQTTDSEGTTEPSRETPPAPAGGESPTAAPAAPSSGQAGSATPTAPAAGTASAAAPAAPTEGSTAQTAPAAPSSGEASNSTSPTESTNNPQPAAPEADKKEDQDKTSAFETLAKHAEALGKAPNDSAAGAGVQINLKHD